MNIRLNAKLSAYSKIDSFDSELVDAEKITHEQIDSLFDGLSKPEAVTKTEIDTLFEEEDAKENASVVSFSRIDTLFR